MLRKKETLEQINESIYMRDDLVVLNRVCGYYFYLWCKQSKSFRKLISEFTIDQLLSISDLTYASCKDSNGHPLVIVLDKKFEIQKELLKEYNFFKSQNFVDIGTKAIVVKKSDFSKSSIYNLDRADLVFESENSMFQLGHYTIGTERNPEVNYLFGVTYLGNILWKINITDLFGKKVKFRPLGRIANFGIVALENLLLNFNLDNGNVNWTLEDFNALRYQFSREERILINANNHITEIDAISGKLKYKSEHKLEPLIEDDSGSAMFYFDERILINIFSRSNKIYFFDRVEGKVIHVHEDKSLKYFLPTYKINYFDDHLFIKDREHNLHVYEVGDLF